MSQSIIETIKQPGIIVVFDVDGVLAPYEWGKNCHHSMPDEEWNLKLANGEDLYRRIRPVKVLQDFISQKNIDEVDTIDMIAERCDYKTIHVSSFL